MQLRPDLLDAASPEGIEVVQLTTDREVNGSHIYMEAQIFTPDSTRLVVHRSAHAHGSDQHDPEHRYLLCDLENDCELSPLTDETGATGPAISPDGRWLYYFVNETETGGGRLTLKRVALDGSERETLLVLDEPLPGTDFRPSRIYPLSTLSSDGRRIAISCFLGDGETEGAPYGLMVFDIDEASVRLILQGPTWCNIHPQYCRSKDAEAGHDILVQENHGNEHDLRGNVTGLTGGTGADIHVIRDDGTNFRNMPWGRDGNERCQGHQCWRGRSEWAITGTVTLDVSEAQLIEGRAAPHAGHVGRKTPGGLRNDLTRDFPDPHFYHFGTDIAGARIVSDASQDGGGAIYLAELGEAGEEPLLNPRYLLSPRTSGEKGVHIHPFLSPDGTTAFFNSDESGLLQAYMIRGL
ncbi:MAG: hypothetical protein ACQER1_10060 [Armatimonadota bacterium]